MTEQERNDASMALRNIIEKGDPSLNRPSRKVVKFDERLHTLIDDMKETLIQANGVGLAAPQVGVNRRVIVILNEENEFVELINPEILESDGEQTGYEGCLSVPGLYGVVTRPMEVTVQAQDRFGESFIIHGTELTARALCHEIDHLEGHLYTEIAQEMITAEEMDALIAAEEAEESENP